MSAARTLAAYRVVFSALLVVASVQTLITERAHHALPLAAAEIAGALLLASRRAQWPGAAVLLAVFAAAQLISALEGQFPTRFLQYAASALLVVLMDRALARAAAPQ